MTTSSLGSLERERLEQDVYEACRESAEGADLLISAFVAALRSYRRGSGFLIDNINNKDFTLAAKYVTHFPPTRDIASFGCDGPHGSRNPVPNVPPEALMLLQWILGFRYRLQTVHGADKDEVLALLLSKAPRGSSNLDMTPGKSIIPSHIFQVLDATEHGNFTGPFQNAKAQCGTFMAFHGTTAESLHGILRCGLLNMSKTHLRRNGAMFGEGVYLSTDVAVASCFSKSGSSWEKSCLGSKVRYVLLCEVARGEGVTFSKSNLQGEKGTTESTLGGTHGAYVVVANSDLIRVRFVLVYRDCSEDFRDGNPNLYSSTKEGIAWKTVLVQKLCSVDRFSAVVLLYLALLLALGFSKSEVTVAEVYFKLIKQLSLFFHI